jgi:hypothetical protein
MTLPKSQQATEQVPAAIAERFSLLQKFAGLVAERYGYVVGRKMKSAEMREDAAVKLASESVRKLTKELSKSVETLIKEPTKPNSEVVTRNRTELEEARDKAHTAREPFLEKMKPLTKVIRMMDNIAIPDSLKEVGIELKPRFQLSEWADKALEATKKK